MIHFIAPLGIALVALGGCAQLTQIAPPPDAIADMTTVDERGSLAIEVAWRAAGAALEAAVDSGRLTGAAAAKADRIDARAERFVGLARAAYDAGNAADYMAAIAQAKPLIAELLRLSGHQP